MDLTAGGDLFGLDETSKEYRDRNNIKFSVINKSGRLPPPIETFDSLALDQSKLNQIILQNISELSYIAPTPVQAQGIPVLLNHRNLIACAPTGSGKTAAYLIPLLSQIINNPRSLNEKHSESFSKHKLSLSAIILAPTQELIRQICSEAVHLSKGSSTLPFIACLTRKHYALRCKPESDSKKNNLQLRKRMRELRLPKGTKILIATPSRIGRLLSLPIDQCPFDLSTLSWLIVDECDKMLEIDITSASSSKMESIKKNRHPRSFREQLAPIFVAIEKGVFNSYSNNQTCLAMFSATVPDEVAEWTRNELPIILKSQNSSTELIQLRIGTRNAAVSTIKQELRYCASEQGKLLEIRYLLNNGLTYPCLIFMESRQRANEIFSEILLSDSDILANVISSDKTENQRAQVIRAFREGKLHVLICTDLLGRGIDFKGVTMVVNYDLPASKSEYIHRIGRTGRAGQHGHAITLWTDSDLPHMADILQVMKRSGSEVDEELARLVNDWKTRRISLMTSKTVKSNTNCPTERLISRRRRERRLFHKVFKKYAKTPNQENGDKAMENMNWLRPWNPYRGRISDVPGALSKKKAPNN